MNDKILRVFTFGSPPVAALDGDCHAEDLHSCSILKSMNINVDKVYGYVQPWVSSGLTLII